MEIRLPNDIEERLNEPADREGRPAEQPAVDAIDRMHPDRSRPQPKPKAVGIVRDGGIDSSKLDEWLAENWFDHLEQATRGSSDGDDDDRSAG